MGQKVNPHGLRVGVIKDWDSRWYAESDFADYLVEDYNIRTFLKKKLYSAGVSKIEIERASDRVKVIIYTAKPGVVIGKGGAEIEKIKAEQPELREVKQARYQEEYGLPAYDAGILTESRHLAGLFEETAAIYGNAKKTANWFMGEVLRLTKDKAMDPEQVSFSPKHLADLLVMVEKSEVSPQNAKKVFEKVFEEDIDPVVYIEEHGLKIVEDTGLPEETINRILDANPGPLSELLGGKDKVMGFFVGQIMKEMKGKANPDSVRKALAEEIERRR